MVIPPELLELGLDELVKIAIVGKYSKSTLTWIKKRIRNVWDEKKYGFTPSPELAKELQKISKEDQYLRLKEVIGKHWSLHLIKLGLQISELNDEGRRDAVQKIKGEVYKKYRTRGVRILTLGSTGVIGDVIGYLSTLKMQENRSQVDMADEFDKILDNWYEITIFHKGDATKERLKKEVRKHMEKDQKMFFVFAYGSASYSATKALAELNNEQICRKMGYMIFLTLMKQDQAGLRAYSWVYQKILDSYNEPKIDSKRDSIIIRNY